MSNTTITVEKQGRRYYLRGDTYAVRNQLRDAGCRFDGAARAWWTGKRDVAERFAGNAGDGGVSDRGVSDRGSEGLSPESRIVGRARYKSREYILVWEGQTRRGPACKLAFTDGSKVFWADAAEVEVTKRYQSREYRGRVDHMTFGKLQRLREDYAAAKREGNEDGIRNGQRYECPECGEYVTRGQGSCWETGASH